MSQFLSGLRLLAQQPDPGFGMMFMPLVMIVVMYWLLIARPQKREMATKAAMLKALKKNDHVLTVGGIYGVVTNVRTEANEVTLRIDDTNNTRMKVTLTSIIRVKSPDDATPAET